MFETKYYKLDDNNEIVEAESLQDAFDFREKKLLKRLIGKTMIGDVRVSTVFLTIDHNYGDGPPILFETMIFGGEHDQFQERYYTYREACVGHLAAIDLVRKKA